MSELQIEAVVFDMDGVLIDAREWHYEALNQALNLFGFSISRNDHEARFDGLPTNAKLKILSSENGLPWAVHGIVSEVKQELTLRIAAERCYPQASHLILLAALKRHGYKLGLATNSIRATTESMLKYAGIYDFFDSIVTNQDVQNPKPHPDVYLKCFENLGVKPSSVLVVEDNPHGIAAAYASGASVYEVANPSEVTVDNLSNILGGLV